MSGAGSGGRDPAVAPHNPVVERLEVSIKAVGVSVVDDTPEELLYTQATGFELLIESTLEGDQNIEFGLLNLQTNDQRTKLERPQPFPVVIGKSRFRNAEEVALIQVRMTKSVATSIPHRISIYQLADVRVGEMDLAFEESLITSVMATFGDTAGRQLKNGILVAKPSGKTLLRVEEVEHPPHPGSDLPTPKPFSMNWYFHLLRVHPIVVNISFKQAMEIENRVPRLEGVRDMMAASGLSSLHNVRFHIDAMEMRNLFGEKNGIIETFRRHYSNQAILEAYKILGSSGLLGDPVGLTTGISNSVAQFQQSIHDAFNKADGNVGTTLLYGSFGLVSGVTRTVAATAGKTVGAVAAVAESIRRPAFAARLIKREDSSMVDLIDRKSVVGGLGMGASSVAGRVGSGLCTVWEVGLAPLTVSLHGASHSLEFIGDNNAQYSEALHRTRPPRVFDRNGRIQVYLVTFGLCLVTFRLYLVTFRLYLVTFGLYLITFGHIQVYRQQDASAMAQLRQLDQGLYWGEVMIGLVKGGIVSDSDLLPSSSTEETPLEGASTASTPADTLVLTNDFLVAMEDGLSHSTWRVAVSEIRHVHITGKALNCLEFEVGKASYGEEKSFFPLLDRCISSREAAGTAAATLGEEPAVDVPLTLRFNCEPEEDYAATSGICRHWRGGAKGMLVLIEEHVRQSMCGSSVASHV